jgi:CBS domain-containing protein
MASTVREILDRKGAEVVTIGPDADVGTAAARMNEHKIGGMVVTDGDEVLGVFTERDIMTKVVGACTDPCQITVGELMSRPVVYCTPDTPLDYCKMVMTDKRIRHLPVVQDRKLVGIVTTGDLLADEVKDHKQTIELLYQCIQSW